MRRAVLAVLLGLAGTTVVASDELASEITCYSGGRQILHAWADAASPVTVGQASIAFLDRQSRRMTRCVGDAVVIWAAPAR